MKVVKFVSNNEKSPIIYDQNRRSILGIRNSPKCFFYRFIILFQRLLNDVKITQLYSIKFVYLSSGIVFFDLLFNESKSLKLCKVSLLSCLRLLLFCQLLLLQFGIDEIEQAWLEEVNCHHRPIEGLSIVSTKRCWWHHFHFAQRHDIFCEAIAGETLAGNAAYD